MTSGYSTKFLKRRVVASDDHPFVGRIFDLSVVQLNFESWDELASYPDCKYAFYCNMRISNLVRRVESLNMVGDLIWVDPDAWVEGKQFIDRYSWLDVASDALLMRLISVHDCSLHLVNDVFELGLDPHRCTIKELKKNGAPSVLVDLLTAQRDDHRDLREERNSRIHQGWERVHSSCDQTFKIASTFEHKGHSIKGKDSNGKTINLNRYMKEGLVELQRDHNAALKVLSRRLDQIYDRLHPEFSQRFGLKFNDPETGFGHRQRSREE